MYDEECREAMREKNEDTLHMLQRTIRQTYDKYKESRKRANKIIHSKKKAHLKKEIENIEFLSNENDSRKFYQTVKKLNSIPGWTSVSIKIEL
jgi:ribosomal protein L17